MSVQGGKAKSVTYEATEQRSTFHYLQTSISPTSKFSVNIFSSVVWLNKRGNLSFKGNISQ